MRKTMRNAVLIAGAILVCAGGTARASTSNLLEAKVPFSFVVNGQTMPAGKYMVQRDDMSSSVLLIGGEAITMPPRSCRPRLTADTIPRDRSLHSR